MINICYRRQKNGKSLQNRRISQNRTNKSAGTDQVTVHYKYRNQKTGALEKDRARLDKLNQVKVPASYTKIEICYDWKHDHWRATGSDGTGQKQYFYSPDHWEESHQKKLGELMALGENLPRIVREIERLLDSREPYQRVLDALALKIIMLCHFRVGHYKNREKHHTYGATTLTRNHVRAIKGGMSIKFVGKKQQVNQCNVDDPQVVWWLKWLMSRRSAKEELLGYQDYTVTPESVNKFLQDFDPQLSAKVWRTWFANAYFINELIEKAGRQIPIEQSERKKMVSSVVDELADQMHHTPEINKHSYLIKDLPEIYINSPETWSKLSGVTGNGTDFLMAFLDYHQQLKKHKNNP